MQKNKKPTHSSLREHLFTEHGKSLESVAGLTLELMLKDLTDTINTDIFDKLCNYAYSIVAEDEDVVNLTVWEDRVYQEFYRLINEYTATAPLPWAKQLPPADVAKHILTERFRISDTLNYFQEAFVMLSQKGYNIDRLCIFDNGAINDTIYGEYLECPMEFITFKGFAKLPNVPTDFELAHIMDEKYSLIFYRYEDGLNKEQLLNKRLEFSKALFYWAEELPRAIHTKRNRKRNDCYVKK